MAAQGAPPLLVTGQRGPARVAGQPRGHGVELCRLRHRRLFQQLLQEE